MLDVITDSTRLTAIGRNVLRYGVVVLLLLFGALKFTAMEAEGIRPLVDNHPLMSWLVPAFGTRGASAIIGGGFLMKDLILLGAALYTAGEALEATRHAH